MAKSEKNVPPEEQQEQSPTEGEQQGQAPELTFEELVTRRAQLEQEIQVLTEAKAAVQNDLVALEDRRNELLSELKGESPTAKAREFFGTIPPCPPDHTLMIHPHDKSVLPVKNAIVMTYQDQGFLLF